MEKNKSNDLIKKLYRLKDHLAEEIAPEVNKLFEESIRFSLIDWYNDYDPMSYKRTYNLMNIEKGISTIGRGNILNMSIGSDTMNNYPGFFNKELESDTAFDFMFMNGEHGHGKWMKHRSIPPYLYVDLDVLSGFDGRINNVIDKAIERILK